MDEYIFLTLIAVFVGGVTMMAYFALVKKRERVQARLEPTRPSDPAIGSTPELVLGPMTEPFSGAVPMSDTQALAVRVTDAAETSTLIVKFVSESAGYRNAVGWYNTETLKGGILFPSIEAAGKHPTVIPGVTTASFVVDNADVGKIGFFLIPDGGRVQGDDDRHEHRHDHRDDDDCGDSDHAPGGPIKVVQLFGGCPTDTKIGIDSQLLHYQELTIKSTFHHTPESVRKAFRLIADGHIDPNAFITADASLDDLPRVLGHMARGGDGLKTAILP